MFNGSEHQTIKNDMWIRRVFSRWMNLKQKVAITEVKIK